MNKNGDTNRTTSVLGDAWVMKDSHFSADDPLVKPRFPEHLDFLSLLWITPRMFVFESEHKILFENGVFEKLQAINNFFSTGLTSKNFKILD